MLVNLNEVVFENEMASVGLPDGKLLNLNVIDESFLTDTGDSAVINRINIELETEDGTVLKCPCAIGVDGAYTKLDTEYKQYLGKPLTADNIKYCTLEYYE